MVFLSGIMYWMPRFRVDPSRYFRRMQSKRLGAKYQGRARNCYVIGIRRNLKSLHYSTEGQALKPEMMDRLYETRITAACYEQNMDKNYFLTSLAEFDVNLDRETLSNLAIYEPRTFQSLCRFVKLRSDEIGLQSTKLGSVYGLEARGVLPNVKKS